MAERVATYTMHWDSCENCPYSERRYSGSDGYGMYDEYESPFCTKGHFGKSLGNFWGKELFERGSFPKCIPPYCEFSDHHKSTCKNSILKLCKDGLTDDEILALVHKCRKDLKQDESN